jgi:hypothetical protein
MLGRALGTAALVTLALSSAASAAHGQPRVRVRAEARLEVNTSAEASRVAIHGTLRDDLGAPLAERPLIVQLVPVRGAGHEHRQEARTGPDGAFRAVFPLPPLPHRVRVAFEGDATHDRAVVTRALDTTRQDVRLQLQIPARGHLDLAARDHEVVVWAASPEGGAGLSVELRDELDRLLGRATTDVAGRARFTVPSEALGPPGPGRLRALSAGDDRRNAAQAEAAVVRERRSFVTLGLVDNDQNGVAILQGHLRDADGPLPGRAVGLFTGGGQHLGTVLTDAHGAFEHRVGPTARASGVEVVRARFDSDAAGRPGAESPAVALPPIPAPAAPWLWLLLPMALTAAILLGLGRLRPRPNPSQPPARAVRAPAGVTPGSFAGRSRDRRDVGGRVVDSHHGAPVPGAMVTLVPSGAAPRSLAVGAQGGFRADDVEGAEVRLHFEAPGHAPVECLVALPHRGEWSQVTVRMESYRAQALAVFRRVALQLLPSLRSWTLWTNREVQRRARAAGAGGRFDDLAHGVERAYYGPVPPTRSDVDALDAEGDAALAEAHEMQEPPAGNPNVDARGGGSL